MSWLCTFGLGWISEVLFLNQSRKNGEEEKKIWLKIVTEKLGAAPASDDTHTAAVTAMRRLPLLLLTLWRQVGELWDNPLTLSRRVRSYSMSQGMIASQALSRGLWRFEAEQPDQKTNNLTRGHGIYPINNREKLNSQHCPSLSSLSIWGRKKRDSHM